MKMVGMSVHWLFNTCRYNLKIAVVPVSKKICRFVIKKVFHYPGRCVNSKSLVYPMGITLVICEHPLIPGMNQFMNGHPDQVSQGSVTGNQSSHNILHTAITPLYDDIFIIWIFPKMLIHILKSCNRIFR